MALPISGQQTSKTPQPPEDKRLLAVLWSPDAAEDQEAKKARAKTPPLSSASAMLPAPLPVGRGKVAGDGAAQYHSFLQFRFSLSQNYDDNVFQRSDRVEDTFTRFSPSVTLERLGRRTSTNFSYRGDGQVYARRSNLNLFGHNLTVRQAFQGARWSASFSHHLNYTPNPLLAFQARTDRGEVNNLLSGLDDSLVVPRTERLFNASTVELGYRKSVRTSFVLSAGYQDARGRGNQFNDYNQVALRAAYNYRHSPRGTLSVFPNVRLVRSTRVSGDSKSYGLFLGYSYQVGERMWVSFHAGPEYTQFEQSASLGLPPELAGLISLLGLSAQETLSLASWAGGANVVYTRSRSAFGVSYSRSVTGSGGVAGPVRNETVGASVSRRLLGRWSSRLAASYSEGRGFDALASSHDSVRASLRLDRQLGEAASFFVSYNFWRQASDFSNLSFTRNSVTVGFSWGSRPVLLGR
jgi:hypothetical protein